MRRLTALALAALLAGCSGGSGSGGSVTATGPVGAQVAEVGMNDKLDFVPDEVKAKVGTVTLNVKNLGGVPHNLVFTDERLPRSTTIGRDETQPVKIVFTKAGTFTFECSYHQGMDGRVVVS